MSKLLINEPPLQVLPSLAAAIGLPEAIVLQQVHYWLGTSRNERAGRKWIYNTYEQWAEQFPFWKPESIRKIFKSLRDTGLILTMRGMANSWDKTNWYSIDYEALQVIQAQEDSTASTGKTERFDAEKSTASTGKTERFDAEKSTASLTETTSETTSETTAGRGADAPRAPTMAGAICNVLKALKMQSVNPSHPKLVALIAAGADVGMFADAGRDCVAGGKGFGYLLGMVEGRMADIAKFAAQALVTPAVQRPQTPARRTPPADNFTQSAYGQGGKL